MDADEPPVRDIAAVDVAQAGTLRRPRGRADLADERVVEARERRPDAIGHGGPEVGGEPLPLGRGHRAGGVGVVLLPVVGVPAGRRHQRPLLVRGGEEPREDVRHAVNGRGTGDGPVGEAPAQRGGVGVAVGGPWRASARAWRSPGRRSRGRLVITGRGAGGPGCPSSGSTFQASSPLSMNVRSARSPSRREDSVMASPDPPPRPSGRAASRSAASSASACARIAAYRVRTAAWPSGVGSGRRPSNRAVAERRSRTAGSSRGRRPSRPTARASMGRVAAGSVMGGNASRPRPAFVHGLSGCSRPRPRRGSLRSPSGFAPTPRLASSA